MIELLRKNGHIIFGFLFLLTVLPLAVELSPENQQHSHNELFSEQLSRINSIEKAIKYSDSVYAEQHLSKFDTLAYVEIISDFVKNRFFHGLSNYSSKDNWIANFSGRIFWSHFSAIVIPNDILRHDEALCSQQTIVFLELLKQKKINYRTVGLGVSEGPGHFLCEVNYNTSWHLYDVTKEPNWNALELPHKSLEYYLSNKNELYQAYKGKIDSVVFYRIVGNIKYGEINEMPAKKMNLFHRTTKILTYLFPVLFLFLAYRSYRRNKAYN